MLAEEQAMGSVRGQFSQGVFQQTDDPVAQPLVVEDYLLFGSHLLR